MKLREIFLFAILMISSVSSIFGQMDKLIMVEPTFGYNPDISEKSRIAYMKKVPLCKKLEEAVSKITTLINEKYFYADDDGDNTNLFSMKKFDEMKSHLELSEEEFFLLKKYRASDSPEIYTDSCSDESSIETSFWQTPDAIGCSWYCGGGPDSIYSSSELKPINNIDYKAYNAHDFNLATSWVEGNSGNGIGQTISYKFRAHTPPVTMVKIYNGYLKSIKSWKENSRVKQFKLYINEKPYAILKLKDTLTEQIFSIGSHQGTTKDLVLKFEIVEVYKGSKYNDVAISELEFSGTGVH